MDRRTNYTNKFSDDYLTFERFERKASECLSKR